MRNLYEAAAAGDLHRVQELLHQRPDDYTKRYEAMSEAERQREDRFPYNWNPNMYGGRPIREAAAHGRTHIVQLLHEHKADLTNCDNHALRWAAAGGFVETVAYLLEHKADVHCNGTNEAMKWAEPYPEVTAILRSYGAKSVVPEKQVAPSAALRSHPRNQWNNWCCIWWHGG